MGIHLNEFFKFKTKTKTLYNENNIPYNKYNFINLDIQGAEYKALKGMNEILNHVDYSFTEVNEKELYEGLTLLPDFDEFLKEKGFERVELVMTGNELGDAFYIRKKRLYFFYIGFNMGYQALDNENMAYKIICVEAFPDTFLKLKNNIVVHKKIIELNYAVCNSINSKINIYQFDVD